MQHRKLITAVVMAAGVATAGGLAYAKQAGGDNNDAIINLAKARISLAQAVTTAEQHVGGRASRAELRNEHGKLVYGVEVSDQAGTTDVKVDANDGSVVSALADANDHESENGPQDEKDSD